MATSSVFKLRLRRLCLLSGHHISGEVSPECGSSCTRMIDWHAGTEQRKLKSPEHKGASSKVLNTAAQANKSGVYSKSVIQKVFKVHSQIRIKETLY